MPLRGRKTGAGGQPRGFTAWWAFTPGLPASRSPAWVCMGYGRLLRPMPWSMKPISPRFRSGWDTQTSARHAYTIGGPQDLRTHQIIKSGIKQNTLKAPSRGAFFCAAKKYFQTIVLITWKMPPKLFFRDCVNKLGGLSSVYAWLIIEPCNEDKSWQQKNQNQRFFSIASRRKHAVSESSRQI